MPPLRILSLEDDPNDTDLIREQLEAENITCQIVRVDTEGAFRAALERGEVDLILADYSLPSFDGISALKLAMKMLPAVPFIFVSGTLGEEVAIEALKIGATDYVLKTGLSRLAPSVLRALREARERAERRRAGDDLRRSQAYLAEAQKLSRTGSFGWNVAKREIYWSEETFRIFEYEPETKITIEKILQRTHPEDRAGHQEFMERISREKTEFDFEHRLLMPDGSVKYLRVMGRPSKDEAGDLEFVGAVSDLTAQKVAEHAKYALEQRHQGDQRQIRSIIDAMPQLIVALALDGRALYGNQAVADYTGLRSEELQGTDFLTRVYHAEDVARIKDERQQALAKGVPFKLEMRARRKDGEYRWFEILYKPLLGENAQVLRWYASSVDIDDRKQAEERVRNENIALREDLSRQELLSLAQKSARAMAFNWYIRQEVNTWSPEQEALYGLAPGTFDGKYESWKKLIHPDDWPLIVKAVKHSHETGDISAEFRVVWPDGSIHWLAANGRMFMDAEGQPYRMVGFTGDITPRKVAEEALRRSQAYLTEAQRLTRSGSWAWNVRTNEVFWSEEMFRIFEYEPEKTKPTMSLFLERVHPEDRPTLEQRARRESTETQIIDSEGGFRIVLPGGAIKQLHSIAHPVADDSGTIVEVVGTTMDVTEQHEARRALETAFGQIKALKDQLYNENIALREEIDRSSMFEEIVGESPALQAVLAHVVKVAPTDSTVLITGETGTGKELIARAIHKRSRRAERAFVSVNCAAIPSSLIASELFGHEKGAFTGAVQRRLGRFELAEGGTIFLDEIGELPPDIQITLLRILQEREFERVGGSRVIRANVRVIAATNRNLPAAIDAGTFRKDLFYRLNVFPIEMPPLRKRREDIPVLVEYFIDRYASKAGKKIRGISKGTLERLTTYSWPGNIRELQNVIERSVVICEGPTFSIDESWLSSRLRENSQADRVVTLRMSASEEREAIETALARCRGRIAGPSGAAARLGIPASTLDSKIKTLNINKHRFKTV